MEHARDEHRARRGEAPRGRIVQVGRAGDRAAAVGEAARDEHLAAGKPGDLEVLLQAREGAGVRPQAGARVVGLRLRRERRHQEHEAAAERDVRADVGGRGRGGRPAVGARRVALGHAGARPPAAADQRVPAGQQRATGLIARPRPRVRRRGDEDSGRRIVEIRRRPRAAAEHEDLAGREHERRAVRVSVDHPRRGRGPRGVDRDREREPARIELDAENVVGFERHLERARRAVGPEGDHRRAADAHDPLAIERLDAPFAQAQRREPFAALDPVARDQRPRGARERAHDPQLLEPARVDELHHVVGARGARGARRVGRVDRHQRAVHQLVLHVRDAHRTERERHRGRPFDGEPRSPVGVERQRDVEALADAAPG